MQGAVVTRHGIQGRRGLLRYEASYFHVLVPELALIFLSSLFKHLSDSLGQAGFKTLFYALGNLGLLLRKTGLPSAPLRARRHPLAQSGHGRQNEYDRPAMTQDEERSPALAIPQMIVRH